MEKQNTSQYLDILQIFRGVAAVMVVIHHSVGSLKYYHHLDNAFLIFIGELGKYGVDFFFVLSGFIISYSSYFKLNQPNAFKHYVVNRILRIYIPYLPIGVGMLLLYTYLPGFSSVDRSISVLTSLTLFPEGSPALTVAWTLTFEMTFYIFIQSNVLFEKSMELFCNFWIISILVYNLYFSAEASVTSNAVLRTLCSLYNLEFLVGYLLSLLIIKQIRWSRSLILGLILFLTVEFLYCYYSKITFYKFFTKTQVTLIVFLVLYYYITYHNYRIRKKAIFMLIGNATYSIYLIHNPLQMLIFRFVPKSSAWTYAILLITIAVIISAAVGYIYYKIFEVYLLNKSKSNLLRNQ